MSNAYSNLQSFVLDPQRDGIANALWFHAVGTPAISSGRFRFNTAEGVVRTDLTYCRMELRVIFPLTGEQTPTDLVNNLEFGLRNLSLGNLSKIQALASKSGNSFTFNTYDRYGSAVQTTTIAWQFAWNGVATRFIIDWFNDRVVLSVINPNTTTEIVLATHKTRVGSHPLNPYVKATGAENFDVDYIAIEKAKTFSAMLV